MIRFRQLLVPVLVLGAALVLVAPTSGATHPDIGIAAPDLLLSGLEYVDDGGSYRQVTTMNGDQFTAVITTDLPEARTTAEPGPVVVYWQPVVFVADNQFGDTYTKSVGPMQTTAVLPSCDDSGACVVHFDVAGPIQPAVEASELDWVHSTWFQMRFTVARTFDDGAFLQAVAPGYADATAGTINDPVDVEGVLRAAAVIQPEDAQPAVLPREDFHGGNEETFDWASATAEALADLPEPGPTATPGRATPFTLTVMALIAVFGAGIAVGYVLRRRSS